MHSKILITGLLLAHSSTVLSQSAATSLSEFDQDNDRVLSQEEFAALYRSRIGEGSAASMQARIELRFSELDTDNTGHISREELEAGMPLDTAQSNPLEPEQLPATPVPLEDFVAHSAGEVLGMPVYTEFNEGVGELRELRRNPASGEVYAVVENGDFVDDGGNEKALPLHSLEMRDERIVFASLNPQEAWRMEGVDPATLTLVEPEELENSLADAFDELPLSDLAAEHPGQLEGRSLVNDEGTTIGSVSSVVMHKQSQDYAVVISLEDGEQVVPVTSLEKVGDNVRLDEPEAARPYERLQYLMVREEE